MLETEGHKKKNPSSLSRILANRLSAILLPHLDKILPHFMVTAQKRIKIYLPVSSLLHCLLNKFIWKPRQS